MLRKGCKATIICKTLAIKFDLGYIRRGLPRLGSPLSIQTQSRARFTSRLLHDAALPWPALRPHSPTDTRPRRGCLVRWFLIMCLSRGVLHIRGCVLRSLHLHSTAQSLSPANHQANHHPLSLKGCALLSGGFPQHCSYQHCSNIVAINTVSDMVLS